MICQRCKKRPAVLDPIYGILDCHICQNVNIPKPSKGLVEFTSEQIKKERLEYASDIEQPHREGKLNKKWVETYGEKAALNRGFTKKEIKNATDVWSSLRFYKD